MQVIDDLTDFYDDIRDRRHNYLVSSIRFEGIAAERSRLDQLVSAASFAAALHPVWKAASLRPVDAIAHI